MWTSARALVAEGTASSTYNRWFRRGLLQCERPFHELPAASRKALQLLRFRLGCHTLPCVTGRRRNPPMPRDQRICTREYKKQMVFECTELQRIGDNNAQFSRAFTLCGLS